MTKPIANLINAPPGSAKTAFMLKQIVRRIKQGKIKPKDVLILVFCNRKAAEINEKLRALNSESGGKYRLNRIKAFTFHAFASRNLKKQGDYFGKHNRQDKQLRMLQQPDREDEIAQESLDLPLEFSGMIKQLASDFAEDRITMDKQYRLIAVDELQVLKRPLVACLIGVLRQCNFPELILTGDSYQDLFSWNKTKDEEINGFVDLNEPLKKYYELRYPKLHYRRGTPGLAKFYNGFEKVAGTNVSLQVHKSLLRKATGASKLYFARPRLVLEQNKKRQIQRLEIEAEKLRSEYPNDSFLIIGRNKWINAESSDEIGKHFKTLHTSLGTEADHVIWADYSNGENPDELKAIIRVGMSRSKRTLTIISADPKATATKWFDPGTYELVDNQRKTPATSIRKNLKHIHKDRNKSLKKQTAIDSIDCRVSHEAAPFSPWFSHNRGAKQKWLRTHETPYRTLKLAEGTVLNDIPTYCVRAKICGDGKRSHSFQFRSLDFLRVNGYSDKDILDVVKNEISYWFEGRVDMQDVQISRIDLAGLYLCDEAQKAELVQQLAVSSAINSRFQKRSIMAFNERGQKFREVQPDSHSVYVNYGNKKAGLTILGYDPSKKPKSEEARRMNLEENRLAQKAYNRDDVFKIEIRTYGKVVKSRFGTDSLAEIYETADGLRDKYLTMSQNLGVIDGDSVLGYKFTEKSRGVFEVEKSGRGGNNSPITSPLSPLNTSNIFNNNSSKLTFRNDRGSGGYSSATEFLRRYL